MPGRFPPTVRLSWLVALALLAAPSSATAAAEPCPSAAATDAAVLCEINAVRANAGRGPLQPRAALASAALAQAGDMVARAYFAHESPEGEGPAQRVRRAGYMRGADRWRIGEVLLWSRGQTLTAAAAVQAWMNSPGHRRVLLTRSYRDAGMGIVDGAPLGDPSLMPATTIAVVVGVRRG